VLDSSTELTIESFNFAFLPGNTLAIEASFKNISEFDFEQPFSFSAAPGTRNIISSTEPDVSDADLGGDGVLSPGEITSPLTFEVNHKGESFSYFIEARAVVTGVEPGPEFIVNTTDDLPDANPGDGVCETDTGLCSLRAAIEETNALSGPNTVKLPAGTYEITNTPISISDDLILEGAGQADSIIRTASIAPSTSRSTRLGVTSEAATVLIRSLSIKGFTRVGIEGSEGLSNIGTLTLEDVLIAEHLSRDLNSGARYGIGNSGRLTLVNCTVEKNGTRSTFYEGGGIRNRPGGELFITDSQFIDNLGDAILNEGSLRMERSLFTDGKGNGLFNYGEATVLKSIIRDHRGESSGAGIRNTQRGVLHLEDSLISNNFMSELIALRGAGIYNNGSMTILRSTISENINASRSGDNNFSSGGGIYNDNEGSLILENSTLSQNSTGYYDEVPRGLGGGLYNRGSASIINSTFYENANYGSEFNAGTASTVGGSVFNEGTLEVVNTIFANSDALNECDGPGTFTSLGNNLVSDDTCGLTQAGDLSDTDPLLGPLADNGGPTPTHALLAGSPAIDAGGDTGLATDQRGVARPQGAAFDIGAFEKE